MKTKEKDSAKITNALAKFLKEVIEFAQSITAECGEVLEYTLNRSHTNTVRELRCLSGFSFRTDMEQTKKGVSRVKVWYDPKRRFEKSGEPLVLVLDVSWQGDLANWQLDKFNTGLTWKKCLLEVILRRESIVAARKAEHAKTARRRKVS